MIKFLNESTAKKYKEKTCVLRIDLNIDPKSEEGLFRLRSVLPTIKLLLKYNVRVVLLSHRGRPKAGEGNKNKEFSLASYAPIMAQHLKVPIDFILANRVGGYVKAVKESHAKVVLLENLRFFKGEEMNDPTFARELAKLGDFYVNDAFAVSHRANASVCAITTLLPHYGGLQLEKEIKNLSGVMKKPESPLLVILGGAKTADKLPLIERFWKRADIFLIAGGPGNTLLAAQGIPMRESIYDAALIPKMKKYAFAANVFTPSDTATQGTKILDIGPETAEEYAELIRTAKTIIWNGPMGLFEKKQFAKGTRAIWEAILENKKAKIVVGGGETIASMNLLPTTHYPQLAKNKNLFLSTGGGAMLEYLAGKELPGLACLAKK